MAQGHGVVAAGALGDSQVGQLEDRLPAPAKAVGDHQPPGVHFTDGGHGPTRHLGVGFGGDVGRLVDQVEAQPGGRDAWVTSGELRPLEVELLLGLFVGPEIELLGRLGHGVARGTVQVQTDVHAVLLSPNVDRLVDFLEDLFVELVGFVRGRSSSGSPWAAGRSRIPNRSSTRSPTRRRGRFGGP